MSGSLTPSNAASSLISSLNQTGPTSSVGATAGDSQMNEFLTLLTAQLKNQDPMSPTDPTQFVAQLAQFSTVEQLVQSNSTLSGMSGSLSGMSLGQYAGLINQSVSATTSTVTVPSSGAPADTTFNVTNAALKNVHVQITSAAGNIVRTLQVSGTTGSIGFDGTDGAGGALPAGQYTATLVGTDTTGATQSAGTLSTVGTVTGVVQANGGWQLEFKDGRTVDAGAITAVNGASSS